MTTTNFFQSIAALNISGDLKINIQFSMNNKMIVSAMLCNETVGDTARKKIPPFSLNGTADQLDKDFFNAISDPLKKTDELLTSMESYLKELDTAKRNSQMEKDNETKDKQAKEERKKKFNEQMKKVNELDEKKQCQLAISALPKADQFPEQAEEINKRLDELRKKNTQQSFF